MNFKKFISLSVVLLGAASVVFAANNTRNVYSVYSNNFNGAHYGASASDADSVEFQLWANQSMYGETKEDTPVEGKTYSRLINGAPDPTHSIWKYGGGGFVSTNSGGRHDMSGYYGGELKFCVRSSSSNITNLKVGIKIADTDEILISLASLGFSANGQWQELSIPLTDSTDSRITSSNLAITNYLFFFNLPETNYVEGESIDFDKLAKETHDLWSKQLRESEYDFVLIVSRSKEIYQRRKRLLINKGIAENKIRWQNV